MKNNLMIKRYRVEEDHGTKNMKTIKSFLGTKLIDIEDSIIIDNRAIQYTDIDEYQNYDTTNLGTNENETLIDLTELKTTYHTIKLQTQDMFNIENNTKWEISIDIKSILKEYLFAKIKEARTFKTIKLDDTKNKSVNNSIYNFITYNILNRYELDNIELYIKYSSLMTSNIFNRTLVQYDPLFVETAYVNDYLVYDYGLVKNDQFENLTPIKLLYNQTKKSNEYRFDYYFNVNYKKI